MRARGEASGFEDYLDRHGAALQRYAFVLTGNAADGEDVVQTALVKAYRQWRRIDRMSSPHAYVRTADLDAIVRGLDCLTAQQRAVSVLRYLLDLSDEDIAAELGCSASSVRSHASRGLQRLRSLLSYPDLEINHG